MRKEQIRQHVLRCPSASFAIYRPPANLFDGIPDGISSERRAEWQSEQRVAGLGNDRVGVAPPAWSSGPCADGQFGPRSRVCAAKGCSIRAASRITPTPETRNESIMLNPSAQLVTHTVRRSRAFRSAMISARIAISRVFYGSRRVRRVLTVNSIDIGEGNDMNVGAVWMIVAFALGAAGLAGFAGHAEAQVERGRVDAAHSLGRPRPSGRVDDRRRIRRPVGAARGIRHPRSS